MQEQQEAAATQDLRVSKRLGLRSLGLRRVLEVLTRLETSDKMVEERRNPEIRSTTWKCITSQRDFRLAASGRPYFMFKEAVRDTLLSVLLMTRWPRGVGDEAFGLMRRDQIN